MGSSFSSWSNVEGAVYTGAGGSSEIVWLLVSVILCIAALVIGARHELNAYRRIEASGAKDVDKDTVKETEA